MIPQEIIDQMLDRLDIVEVISDYIQLKKSGRNFKACCPFHNEKTPSFVVSPDKQIYHCFGCHAGGNALNFVMKYENMEFPEAARSMSQRTGVEIPEYKKTGTAEHSKTSRLYKVNEAATIFYQNCLRNEQGKAALEYFKKRGIEDSTLSEFRIGYAPDGWENLKRYGEGKKIPSDLMREAGLTLTGDKGRGDYDRFRNRVIFPIFNERGHIAAFGGRVMDDSLPKYINSPESPVYSKGNLLYGLNFSKRSIREKDCAVIVEGYMDMIVPFQHGVSNVVATLGTALTLQQVNMLKRQASNAVMVFDSDQAGEAAGLRGLDILIENGMHVKLAVLPEGEDPDSFVSKNGKEAFEDIINTAKDLFDYKLDLLIKKFGARNIGKISEDMLPTISKVPNAVIQSDYIKKMAERLGIHEASLRFELGKIKPERGYQRQEPETTEVPKSRTWRVSEIHLLGLAISGRKHFDKISSELDPEEIRDMTVRKVMSILKDLYMKDPDGINPGKLLGRVEGDADARSAIVQAIAQADITQDKERSLSDCIACLRNDNVKEKLNDLTQKLKKAQASDNGAEIMDLVNRINKIHKEKAHNHADQE